MILILSFYAIVKKDYFLAKDSVEQFSKIHLVYFINQGLKEFQDLEQGLELALSQVGDEQIDIDGFETRDIKFYNALKLIEKMKSEHLAKSESGIIQKFFPQYNADDYKVEIRYEELF